MSVPPSKDRAPRNRTISIDTADSHHYRRYLAQLSGSRFIIADAFEELPRSSGKFDLLFADPPYNLSKTFGKEKFAQTSDGVYEAWLDSWVSLCVPLLKDTASIYICGDWRSAGAIERVGSKYFRVQNPITWAREKGRGAKKDWKHSAEDT